MHFPVHPLLLLVGVSLASSLSFGRTLDFIPGAPLTKYDGVEKAYVQHHLSANKYGLQKVREKIENGTFPHGCTLQFDWEPWIKNKNEYTWYGDATDEENLEHFARYAWFIRELTPLLVEKEITLQIYSTPTLMPRNWARVWRDKDTREYRQWNGNQMRVLAQAEQAGLLSALRDCGGHVAVVGYLPSSWLAPRWAHQRGRALRRTIDHMDEVLDARDVPHIWLWRAAGTPEDMMRICIEKTHGRSAWWEEADNVNAIKRLLATYKEF